MRAIIHSRYGPPEVCRLQDVPRPQPKPQQVLVKVIASTVNRTDCGFRSANYFISRFWSGLLRPKHQVLGCEFAGIVEETGNAVAGFRKGDAVVGYNDLQFGGHAEYLVIDEQAGITHKPPNFSFEEAAALMEGAHYALFNIRAAGVQPGQHVMVYGATGAIGTAAVQLLKYFGAKVTAVCNTKNVELVKSLGADVVVDYQKEDYTQTTQQYNFIFDAVGKSRFPTCNALLQPKGIYISTEFGKHGENIFYALWTPLRGGKKLLFPIPATRKEDIVLLADLATKKLFRPVIDRVYPLEEIVEAYRYVETGQKTGNVIIRVTPANEWESTVPAENTATADAPLG